MRKINSKLPEIRGIQKCLGFLRSLSAQYVFEATELREHRFGRDERDAFVPARNKLFV
jgi:hypothetical protein